MPDQTRQLAAIMFTDIVGYTRLMGDDEQRALELLRTNRSLHKSIIKKHHGKWLKEMGDGTLASFKTISDAVYCAGDIQETSKKNDIQLKIGIHQGEITEENGDIFGDGVNIASRLESLAKPGQILVSEAIHRNSKNKTGLSSTFLREADLKNVDEPIRIYHLEIDLSKTQVPSTARHQKHSKKSIIGAAALMLALVVIYALSDYLKIDLTEQSKPQEIAITVLPFQDLSPQHDQEYFSVGISSEIQNLLSKIPELKVINTPSSAFYKGENMNRTEEESIVTHILDGSVRKSGNSLRITTKLINASDATQIWSDTYDKTWTLDNLLNIQDEIAEAVTKQLKIVLKTGANERRPTTNLEAYDLYLKGEFYIKKRTLEDIDSSIVLYQKAIALDNNFAMAYSALAYAYLRKNLIYEPSQQWEEKAYSAVQIAFSLNPDLAEAYVVRGSLFWSPSYNFRIEEALNEFEKAIQIKPSLSLAFQQRSLIQNHIGLLDEALISARKSMELDPLNYRGHRLFGQALLDQGNYAESLEMCKKIQEAHKTPTADAAMAMILFYLHHVDEAIEIIEASLLKNPNNPALNSRYAIFLASQGRNSEARERMALAIDNIRDYVHSHHTYHYLASASALLGEKKEAVNWLNKAANDGLISYPLFNNNPNLASLKGDPDFEAFMLKMKTKLEYYKLLYESKDQ